MKKMLKAINYNSLVYRFQMICHYHPDKTFFAFMFTFEFYPYVYLFILYML